jgi:GNAT superfamily N-acetyltransferase
MIRVHPAGPEDEANWRRLWREWQTHMKGVVPERVTADAWAAAQDRSKGLHILLARDDKGTALGFANVSETMFAWTGGPILFLQDLFLSEAARGQGAGETLLKAVYDLADRIGASQVFWMVDEGDERLQSFYARHGIRSPYLRYMRKPWPW